MSSSEDEMYTEEQLAISDFQRQQLPNLFFRQQQSTARLALIYPGMRYTTDMPTLYYVTLLLLARGADVLLVQYQYYQSVYQLLDAQSQFVWLSADAYAAYTRARQQRSYNQITLVGQSLGTLALGSLIKRVPASEDVYWLWFAPLLTNTQLSQQLEQLQHPSLFVSGSGDHFYDITIMERLKHKVNISDLVVPQANHSLEYAEDAVATSQAHTSIVQTVAAWLPE